MNTQDRIAKHCDDIKQMLLEKNRRYGDSALNPVRIFSKASASEQILVRLDDKLSRLRSGQADEDEDVIADLIGYLILLRISNEHRTVGSPLAGDELHNAELRGRAAVRPVPLERRVSGFLNRRTK